MLYLGIPEFCIEIQEFPIKKILKTLQINTLKTNKNTLLMSVNSLRYSIFVPNQPL